MLGRCSSAHVSPADQFRPLDEEPATNLVRGWPALHSPPNSFELEGANPTSPTEFAMWVRVFEDKNDTNAPHSNKNHIHLSTRPLPHPDLASPLITPRGKHALTYSPTALVCTAPQRLPTIVDSRIYDCRPFAQPHPQNENKNSHESHIYPY